MTNATDDMLDLNTADNEAIADLPRQARAQQFRQSRRSQISLALPALLLVALGVLYLINPPQLTAPLALGVGIGALGIGLIARFLLNARRERGLFFVGLSVLLWIGFAVAVVVRQLPIDQLWPLLVMAVGLAALLTFLFERTHERGLILPGFLLIVAGGVLLLFTLNILSIDALRVVAAYWPLLLVVVALALWRCCRACSAMWQARR